MRTVAFCEIEPFCRAVLRKHWPHVEQFTDVRELSADALEVFGVPRIDVICGGFPCQDISHAAGAKAKGLEGERSGLWFEMLRLVQECRPDWVLVENVPRLRTLGVDQVFDGLEAAGYTARPVVVGAVHAGADHIRRRVWIIANSHSVAVRHESRWRTSVHRSVTDANVAQLEVGQGERGNSSAQQPPAQRSIASLRAWQDGPFDGDSVADGLPEDLDAAIKAYGNSVVPQVVEIIGRAIMKAEAASIASAAS